MFLFHTWLLFRSLFLHRKHLSLSLHAALRGLCLIRSNKNNFKKPVLENCFSYLIESLNEI